MIYTKTDQSGNQIFSDCRVIEMEDGTWISNPTPEQIAEAGWEEYIPPVVPPAPSDEPDFVDMMTAVKRMLSQSVEDLTDEEALEVAALFPTWHSMIGKEVATGQRLWDNEKLWKVLQPHTVQDNWRPEDSPSLYVEVTIEPWPAWVQPISAETAYAAGAHVSHNEKHWESDVDNNTWEPGVYGWHEV